VFGHTLRGWLLKEKGQEHSRSNAYPGENCAEEIPQPVVGWVLWCFVVVHGRGVEGD